MHHFVETMYWDDENGCWINYWFEDSSTLIELKDTASNMSFEIDLSDSENMVMTDVPEDRMVYARRMAVLQMRELNWSLFGGLLRR
jgi:hypothetical protein